MKPKTSLRHLRLLPAAMIVMAGLLAVKGVSLVEAARAEAAAGQAPAEETAKPQAKPQPAKDDTDPADDGASTSPAEVDVLTSLAKRRKALDAEARTLDMRANLLTAAEKRVDAKIADLKALKNQIQALLGQRDEAQMKQITALVKVYSAMKPRHAARIFNTLNQAVLLDVAGSMKPDALGAIMAAMNPAQAQDLTVKLADRFTLPAKAQMPSAAHQAVAPTSSVPAAPQKPAPQPGTEADASSATPTGTAATAAPPAGG